MQFRHLLPAFSRPQLLFLLFSLVGIGGISLYLWSLIPSLMAVLAISFRLAAFFLALTAFFYWQDWRALPLAALFFLMTFRLLLLTLLSSGHISSTPLLSTMSEATGLLITLLTVWVMVYLWSLFSYRQKIEEARQKQSQTEDDLRTMLEYSYDWDVWHGVDGKCKLMSPSCERITGYSREEFAKNPELFFSIVIPEDREDVITHYHDHTTAHKEKSEIEFRLLHTDGAVRWIWHQCQSVHDHYGHWAGRRATNRDITRIKEKEELLRHSEQLLNEAQHIAKLGHWELDIPGEKLSWSNETFQIFEKQPELLTGRIDDFLACIHPEDREYVRQSYVDSVAQKSKYDIQHRVLTSNGETKWVREICTTEYDEQGNAVRSLGIVQDISDQRRMEREVLATRDRLAFIIDAARLGTWDWNITTGAIIFNQRWAEMLGYALGELEPHISTWEKMVHPDDLVAVTAILNEHLEGRTPVYATEHRLRHKSGQWVWVFDTGKVVQRDQEGKPLRALGIHLDITHRKTQELQNLETSQRREQIKRLESLKTMAGAVAHRFNNSMMVVLGNLEMLLRILPSQSRELEMCSMASQAAREASKVGTSMLTYIGHGIPHLQLQDLVVLTRDVLFFLQDKIPSAAVIRIEGPSQPVMAEIDIIQIREVLTHVLMNAIEALDQSDGEIAIIFGNARYHPDDIPLLFRENLPAHETYVFCQVTDTGCGIPPIDMERIFEPFFTSKFVGRGLGLALSAGIMRAHHGAILVSSSVNQGTTARLLFPAPNPSISPPSPSHDHTN